MLPPDSETGYLYIAQLFFGKAELSRRLPEFQNLPDLLKIGKSNNPEKRINFLQTCSPFRIMLMAAFKCNDPFEVERELHGCLSEFRFGIGREWFLCTPESKKIIADFVIDRWGAEALILSSTVYVPVEDHRQRYRDYFKANPQ